MHHHSHRHVDCCESSEPCCEPPISWPPRPSFPSFPGIATFWPMPFAIPMLPSLGIWGGMRSGYGPQEYSYRRHDMYRYRCCEPRCCERCGEYECRCERRCCERCGQYECRCERRCCERCGCMPCRCGGYRGGRAVKLIVLPADIELNFAISLTPEYLPSHVQPVVKPLRGEDTGATIKTVWARSYQGTVEIVVGLDKSHKPDYYTGSVYDRLHPGSDPIALLKLRIF
jgi:hypothetical protein